MSGTEWPGDTRPLWKRALERKPRPLKPVRQSGSPSPPLPISARRPGQCTKRPGTSPTPGRFATGIIVSTC